MKPEITVESDVWIGKNTELSRFVKQTYQANINQRIFNRKPN